MASALRQSIGFIVILISIFSMSTSIGRGATQFPPQIERDRLMLKLASAIEKRNYNSAVETGKSILSIPGVNIQKRFISTMRSL